MRLRKGSKVEVFCQDEKPAGSWRSAEIIHGNGHNYTVRYDVGQYNEIIEERVSRKLLRPSPPVMFSENWRPGDVIEVLHNFSWKMATVSKVLVRDRILVRLVGSSNEFEVNKFDIRVRQSWLDGRWVVVGKHSMNYNDRESNQWPTMKHNAVLWSQVNGPNSKIEVQTKLDHIIGEKHITFQSSHNVSSKLSKRDSSYFSQAEACRLKFRVVDRDRKLHPVIVENFYQSSEKLGNNALREEVRSKNSTPFFAKNRKRSFSSMVDERIRRDGAVECSAFITTELNDVRCSTSSSSIGSNDPFNCFRGLAHHHEDAEDYSSDAESVCCSNEEETNNILFSKEETAAEIHRLELRAYRCTMEAFHASGPLSWEQETLMTNLRISLHISNDEHLMELRNLISNSSCTPVS